MPRPQAHLGLLRLLAAPAEGLWDRGEAEGSDLNCIIGSIGSRTCNVICPGERILCSLFMNELVWHILIALQHIVRCLIQLIYYVV